MGILVDGQWHGGWQVAAPKDGKFVRSESQFRNWLTADGSPGPSGDGGFAAEAGRYHLYVSLACPWAHRTLIYRKLKGLEDAISLSVVDPYMGANGWEFGSSEGCIPDPIHGAKFLHEIYTKADPQYSGRVTVPVLWDKQRNTMVSPNAPATRCVSRNPIFSSTSCSAVMGPAPAPAERPARTYAPGPDDKHSSHQ